MADAHNQLRPLCEDPPADLVDYFDTFPIADFSDPLVGLLPLADALAWSADFRTFHPLAEALGLVVLDDANTSNHHCYITRGPLAGSILYLVHDGDSAVAFERLRDYLRATAAALEAGVSLDDRFHDHEPTAWVTAPDQAALATAVRGLIRAEEDETAVAQLLVYIAALDLSDAVLLEALARHSNLYVVEAVGNAIARRPRPELIAVAGMVSEHEYFQVANAGKRAVAAIRAQPGTARDRGGHNL
jgi:hypothetical protein